MKQEEAARLLGVCPRTFRRWRERYETGGRLADGRRLQQLSAILQRRQIHVVKRMLHQWCTNVNRSKVDPMKAVAKTVRKHLDGIAAWARTRQTNGFLEALNGLIQAAKRKARGYRSFQTMRTVIFLVAGKLDFERLNPHLA